MTERDKFVFKEGIGRRVALTEGTFNIGESISLTNQYAQLYGNGEELKGFPIGKPTLIRYDRKSGTDLKGFVFILGSISEGGHDIDCKKCGRTLVMNILDGQVVRVTIVCPDCKTLNPVYPATR